MNEKKDETTSDQFEKLATAGEKSGSGIPSTFLLTSIQTDRTEPQFLHVPS